VVNFLNSYRACPERSEGVVVECENRSAKIEFSHSETQVYRNEENGYFEIVVNFLNSYRACPERSEGVVAECENRSAKTGVRKPECENSVFAFFRILSHSFTSDEVANLALRARRKLNFRTPKLLRSILSIPYPFKG